MSEVNVDRLADCGLIRCGTAYEFVEDQANSGVFYTEGDRVERIFGWLILV